MIVHALLFILHETLLPVDSITNEFLTFNIEGTFMYLIPGKTIKSISLSALNLVISIHFILRERVKQQTD